MTSPIPFPVDLNIVPDVTAFFDAPTNTISYVVRDPAGTDCAIIDSVMDIDYSAGSISFGGADAIIANIKAHGLRLQWLIETHVHADHLSAAPYIQGQLGGRIGIGEHIVTVQETFGKIFNEGTEFQRPNGRDIAWETSVRDERAHNLHVRDGVSEDDFVALREARDKTLPVPKLILPALQVNMRAGNLPPSDEDGHAFFKVPINGL